MGLTSAMYTGLSGMHVNQSRVETIGHNLANVNTNAYRGFRTLFQTQMYQTMSHGTAPSDSSGGTNPMQLGHGAMVATTHRTMRPGTVETTGEPTDVAVEGNGYFVVQSADGRRFYTRDGAFTLNARNELTTGAGMYVRGYGVDPSFNIIPGELTNLTIPLGIEDVARATTSATLDGDLSAATDRATAGAISTSQALVAAGGGQAVAGTDLTLVRSAANPGVPLFAAGDTITVTGVERGDRELAARTFVVGEDGRTLGDFANWLQDTFAIEANTTPGAEAGVTIENGQIVVRSNLGVPNAVEIEAGDLRSTNAGSPLPLNFASVQQAVGGGVFTSLTVYDSLGNAVPVNATFVMEEMTAAGPTWRYYLESADPSAAQRLLGSGTVTFDTNGQFVSASGNQLQIDRGAAGASPLSVTLDFSRVNGLATGASNLIMNNQDGYPPGTLVDFGIAADGMITGVFSNGISRNLGQVVVATFSNDLGLVAESENLYSAGANSGEPAIKTPGSLGAGTLRSGALEMSNVDISSEFIGLISSSTAFQAASRVITTANEMLDQLLLALR